MDQGAIAAGKSIGGRDRRQLCRAPRVLAHREAGVEDACHLSRYQASKRFIYSTVRQTRMASCRSPRQMRKRPNVTGSRNDVYVMQQLIIDVRDAHRCPRAVAQATGARWNCLLHPPEMPIAVLFLPRIGLLGATIASGHRSFGIMK